MTQFDAGATPMFNCFQKTCQATPFTVLTPPVNLFAKNTAKSPFAKESARMDFHRYDLAPEDQLNRIYGMPPGERTPPTRRPFIGCCLPINIWLPWRRADDARYADRALSQPPALLDERDDPARAAGWTGALAGKVF
jgi:hypothetical protein